MERVLLFHRPLRFDYTPEGVEKEEIDEPAFGFVLPDVFYTPDDIAGYLEYLVAAEKWDQLGGDIEQNTWIMNGTQLGTFDAEIQEFIEKSNKECKASAEIYEVSFDLTKGQENTFITDLDLVKKIREEGQLLDVLGTPFLENEGGV